MRLHESMLSIYNSLTESDKNFGRTLGCDKKNSNY